MQCPRASVSLMKRGTPFPVSPSGLLVAGRGQMFGVFLERTHAHVAVVERVDALDGRGERLDRRQARARTAATAAVRIS